MLFALPTVSYASPRRGSDIATRPIQLGFHRVLAEVGMFRVSSILLLSLQNFLQFVHFSIHLLHGTIELLIIHHRRLKKRHHDGLSHPRLGPRARRPPTMPEDLSRCGREFRIP
jgi:hypothetical protein